MKTIKQTVIIVFILICFNASAQNLDSLKWIYNTKSQPDTVRLNALHLLARAYLYTNPDSAIILAQQQILLAQQCNQKKQEADANKTIGSAYISKSNYQQALSHNLTALKIYEEIADKKGVGNCYNNIGIIYLNQANYPKALEFYLKSLKVREEINDKQGIGACYTNIGIVYQYQTNYPKALEAYFKDLKTCEELHDEEGIGACYSNIGNIYQYQINYPKALEYQLKSLQIRQKINDKQGIGNCYINIGNIYINQTKYTRALIYFLKALQARKEIDDKQGEGDCYANIGNAYCSLHNYAQALTYYVKGLNIAKEVDNKACIAVCYINLGDLNNKLGNPKIAIQYSDSALQLSKQIGDMDDERLSYQNLAYANAKINNYQAAYENHIKFKTLTDKIFNEYNSKQLSDIKTNFEVEKKEAELKAKAEAQQTISLKEKKLQQYALVLLCIFLLIVIVFSFFLYKRFIITQKQKNIIERQKHLVDEKQKEIIDSITYAKRLQDAILPPEKFINENLPTHFVFYRPKDIVAGDFYWAEKIGNLFFMAAADSTGHGVPGAMVSVVCSNALNRSVKEFHLTETGKILDKTRELVLETFEKSTDEVKDGMDISLLCINQIDKEIYWSGANNPLWYIQNNELTEIKADKQSIGKTDNPQPFTTHKIEYKGGCLFYLLTDGFSDQFGGNNGKKFKYKQLKEKFLANNNKPLEEQKNILSKAFNEWRGNLEQVDDVTIIGIKI